jgi:uncharacterized phage protein (TIGR01671 family)
MFGPTELDDQRLFLSANGWVVAVDKTYPDGTEDTYWTGHWTNRLVLMQYTGLKDKNGVEIYEADIISWSSQELEAPELYEVVWDSPCFWRQHNQNPEYTGGRKILNDPGDFQVIGNIYENPELLVEDKS